MWLVPCGMARGYQCAFDKLTGQVDELEHVDDDLVQWTNFVQLTFFWYFHWNYESLGQVHESSCIPGIWLTVLYS